MGKTATCVLPVALLLVLWWKRRHVLRRESKQRIDAFTQNYTNQFHTRRDPYFSPSEKISAYLSENSNSFVETAKKIVATDRSDVMRIGDTN